MISQKSFFTKLRKLAKNNYWQTLYAQAKENSGIHLFENQISFTFVQIYFLNQLAFYNSLFLDIAMGDVTEVVLQDEIYEDSYMFYKSKENKKRKKIQKSQMNQSSKLKGKPPATVNKNSWILKNRFRGKI